MEVEHECSTTERLEKDADYNGGHAPEVVKAFRKRMQGIRAAVDERDLASVRSWRFEKLKGQRAHQFSIRLNSQWRLILEIKPGSPKNTIVIKGIEDYH